MASTKGSFNSTVTKKSGFQSSFDRQLSRKSSSGMDKNEFYKSRKGLNQVINKPSIKPAGYNSS
jgi:hypothetical protein